MAEGGGSEEGGGGGGGEGGGGGGGSAQYEVNLNLKIMTQFDMSTIINPFALLLAFIKPFLYSRSTWFHFELNLS